MRRYSTINEAIERINRAIDALETDIREWNLVKASLFKNRIQAEDENGSSLHAEFDTFLNRSIKVRENLMVFRSLFDTVSVN